MNQVGIVLLMVVCCACATDKPPVEMEEKNKREGLWLTGDFDGDQRQDTLHEYLISELTGKEILPDDSVGYDSLVALIATRKPLLQLVGSRTIKDTLKMNSMTGQLFGLSYLKQIGDNNKNTKDEIALVFNWADWSQVNHLVIYELDDRQLWTERRAYEIREFDIDAGDSVLYQDEKGKWWIRTYAEGMRVDSLVILN